MAAGASGYVLKWSATVDLARAILHVSAGHTYLDPSFAARMLTGSHPAHPSDTTTLSDRESMVVRQIACGYSNKQIAAAMNLSVKTIETYKRRAMEKINARSRVDIVTYASQKGWLRSD